LLAGKGGKGKSQLTIMLAAATSTGRVPPDHGDDPCIRGRVLILSAEDDNDDTLGPRLQAAGADMSMVEIINGIRNGNRIEPFRLTEHLEELTKLIEDFGDVKLVIIDPISAYLGKVDDYNNSQLRQAMEPFVRAVAKHGAGAILITHLNKMVKLDAIDRIVGSVAYVNLVRSVLIADEDKETGTKFVYVGKNNNAPEAARLNYSIEVVPVTQDGETVEATKVLCTVAPKHEVNKTPRASAKARWREFFARELKDGCKDSRILEMAAQAQGLSWSQVSKHCHGVAEAFKEPGKPHQWRLLP
jgi:putative DNA primase/helicase